jgi:hypothetical protein
MMRMRKRTGAIFRTFCMFMIFPIPCWDKGILCSL